MGVGVVIAVGWARHFQMPRMMTNNPKNTDTRNLHGEGFRLWASERRICIKNPSKSVGN